MRSDTYETRLLIMRTAERLFCERGVDRVSMLEIQEAANQRNHSAVKYHFGDVRGLVEAILQRHSTPIQLRWLADLDALDAPEHSRLRAIVSILVNGLAAKLDDADGGPEYLELSAQLVGHPTMALETMNARGGEGAIRMGIAVNELAPIPREIQSLRAHRLVVLVFTSLAARAREERSGLPPTSRRLALSDLVDTLVAMLHAAPSAETSALLSQGKSPSSAREESRVERA